MLLPSLHWISRSLMASAAVLIVATFMTILRRQVAASFGLCFGTVILSSGISRVWRTPELRPQFPTIRKLHVGCGLWSVVWNVHRDLALVWHRFGSIVWLKFVMQSGVAGWRRLRVVWRGVACRVIGIAGECSTDFRFYLYIFVCSVFSLLALVVPFPRLRIFVGDGFKPEAWLSGLAGFTNKSPGCTADLDTTPEQ